MEGGDPNGSITHLCGASDQGPTSVFGEESYNDVADLSSKASHLWDHRLEGTGFQERPAHRIPIRTRPHHVMRLRARVDR